MSEETRKLPSAVDFEEAILGAILLEFTSEPCMNVMDFLEPEYFFSDNNQIIFRAIKEMYSAGDRVDILTVTQKLRDEKTLDQVGGAYYISQLTNRIGGTNNVEFHGRIVQQKWIYRKIIFYGSLAANRSYNQDPDVFGIFDDLREFLLIEDKIVKHSSESQAIGESLQLETADYDERAAARMNNRVKGVPTGLYSLDRSINGWQEARLIIVAARPGMGKTSFVKGVSLYASMNNYPVAFFSLEMTKLQMIQSVLTGLAEVDNERYQRGMLSAQEIQELEKARAQIESIPFFIDDSNDMTITNIRSKSRKLKQKHDIKMVVVDYLQLVAGTKLDRRSSNREQEISGISRGLKSLSRELNIPVIALSQLSRETEKRSDKRPQLSDLRESGAIEQDADMVLFIHRPEYYGQFTDPNSGESTAGKAELIIAKNRGGSVETIDLNFVGQFTKFVDNRSAQFGGLTPNHAF